jgi:hypothetical protein
VIPAVGAIPRIAAVDGEALRRLILGQLRQRELTRCVIVAYRFNDFDLEAGPTVRNRPTSLIRLLERACMDGVALTMLTRDPLSEVGTPIHVVRAWHESLLRLRKAGAAIRIHPVLHAKVYLFQLAGGRSFYAVGSSNLTYQGLGYRWAECNVRGYHPAEYELVARHIGAILQHRSVGTLDEWEAALRRSRPVEQVRAILE